MSEILSPRALTTLARVKDRIFDSTTGATVPSNFDTVLIRMINSASDWFRRECGNRDFIINTYVNEIYSATGSRQKRLVLRQGPVFFATLSGNTTSGSQNITAVSGTTGVVVGMPILGENIPSGALVSGISGSTITMSAAATGDATGGYFQINGIINFEFRAGPPSNPNWTPFIYDQYELVNTGLAGVLRIYGVLPGLYNNMARVTYVAGYSVDWPNAGNETTHTLPADLSNTVENLVVRVFKRRMLAGRVSEGVDQATTAWNKEIDEDDKAVIGHYLRMPTIF